jgi:hypothetical protein
MGVRVQSRIQARRLSAFNFLNYPTLLVVNHAFAHVKAGKKRMHEPVVGGKQKTVAVVYHRGQTSELSFTPEL